MKTIETIADFTESTVAPDPKPLAVQRCEILGTPVDLVDYETTFKVLQNWRASDQRQYVVLATASDIQKCHHPAMRAAALQAGLSLPDGIAITLAAKMLGHHPQGRVIGPELMLRVCDRGRIYGYRHYFYGGTTIEVIKKLKQRLIQRYPGLDIVGYHSPPFRPLNREEDQLIIQDINACRPDVVWVGLGGTKQIRWMADHVDRVNAPVMIGVGAAFDFHSGVIKRAPAWMQRGGIEWIYRLCKEPVKITPRIRLILIFLARVATHALTTRITRCPDVLFSNQRATNPSTFRFSKYH